MTAGRESGQEVFLEQGELFCGHLSRIESVSKPPGSPHEDERWARNAMLLGGFVDFRAYGRR